MSPDWPDDEKGSALKVFLFKSLKILSDRGEALEIGSPKVNSLFAYLVLNRNAGVDRQQLAFTFWPDSLETNARRSLRQYLHRVRRQFDEGGEGDDVLLTEGNTVQINPETDLWVDVEEFLQCIRPDSSLAELQSAVSLYSGDLLANIYDDWCQDERVRLGKLYVNSLGRVSSLLEASGNPDSAITYTQKWAAREPLDEEAHRRLMRLYYQAGDRIQAIQQYQTFSEVLFRELEIEPLEDTKTLYQAIRNGEAIDSQSVSSASFMIKRAVDIGKAEIVGRDEELRILGEALNAAQNGKGGVVLITGESGIGKTRLAEEHIHGQAEVSAIQILCRESEAMVPFAPLKPVLMEALERLSGHSAYIPPSWESALASVFPRLHFNQGINSAPAPQSPATLALDDVISTMITGLSMNYGAQPLQIVLDDLHWGDHSTWEILSRLAISARKAPLLVIGLCRHEDLSPEERRLVKGLEIEGRIKHIRLERLTSQETTTLAKSLMPGKKLDTLIQSRLFQETEGNPFFVVEYIRAFKDAGRPIKEMLVGEDGGQSETTPATIRRLIEARLHQLPPTSQELLATAGTIGRGFTLSILTEVSQEDTGKIVDYIEEWQRQGLIREDAEGYDFGHEKIRQVAHGMLSRAKRQYIHRRIAEVLENTIPPGDGATIAYHYTRSDKPIKAISHLTKTGEQALRIRSYHTARQFGLQAINLLGRTPGPRQKEERIDLNLQLAQAYAFAGDMDRAIQIIEETEHLAVRLDDERRLGEIFRRSAQMYWLRGAPGVAGDYARRALRAAEETKDIDLLQAALRMLGRVSIATSAFDDAIAYLLRYINLEQEGRKPPNLPVIHGYLGVAYTRVGSWGRAEEAAKHGVALAEQEGFPATVSFARMQLASVYADYRDWEASLQTLEPVSEVLKSDRALAPHEFMLLSIQGRVLCNLGEVEEGKRLIQTALKWAEDTGYRVFHYLPRFFLGECCAVFEDNEGLCSEVHLAVSEAQRAGNRWAVGYGKRLMAEAMIGSAGPDWMEIEDLLIESMHIFRQVRARPDLARTYLALRRLYDRAGQIAWAVDCHFRATTIFEESGMMEELHQAQGQAGGDRKGAVVIPDLRLRGPHTPVEKN